LHRISKTMLDKSWDSEHSCLIPDYSENDFSFSLLRKMLAICLSYITFMRVRCIHCIINFITAFIKKRGWILSNISYASIEMIMWFLYFFCLFAKLHLLICRCWYIPVSLTWN
jgi:hypothetical protein